MILCYAAFVWTGSNTRTQRIPLSDAAFSGVRLGSTLFATRPTFLGTLTFSQMYLFNF